ncbi:Chromatin accessibility complex protein 1 like protein [Argiope bruennichi]|uniref:Chromatin accessibility complex protein 1 n=1 Tax=Argiope bruennichi TaxID=94029 RepID=A0A8T0FF61_ARGBR|nr:Chromatin accessibility complex protein 1 like protein [Argiope bruennichi]
MVDNKSKSCILPMARIKTVMKGSPEVENISNEAIFVMTKAAEGFVALLLRQTLKASDNKKQVDYPDLANIVNNNENFVFLRDIIPPKIKGRGST